MRHAQLHAQTTEPERYLQKKSIPIFPAGDDKAFASEQYVIRLFEHTPLEFPYQQQSSIFTDNDALAEKTWEVR